MESLGSLNASLPPEQQAEQALAASFRNAALALTGLFKHGKKASTKAYLAGQKQAFQEVLEFVQMSLNEPARGGSSVGAAGGYGASAGVVTSGGGLDVARLINFICARQEAITAEEEENNDDDDPSPSAATVPPRRAASAAPAPPSPLRPGMLPRSASAVPAPPPRPASAAPSSSSQHQHQYQLRQHHPVASTSSSAPASPPSSAFSPPFTRPTLFSSTTGSGSSTAPAGGNSFTAPPSPSPLGPTSSASTATPQPTFSLGRASAGGGAPPASPLTRPSSHSRSHRSRTNLRGSKSGTATPSGTGAGGMDGEGDGINLSAGMKRRWGVAGVAGTVGGARAVSPANGVVELPAMAGEGGAMEVEAMMDMEGWDGVGERPYKRLTRTARGSGASTPAGGGAGGQEQQ
ncbi:hypothetical protein JCM11251_003898 [Rhodosporidiobolus azoricus]